MESSSRKVLGPWFNNMAHALLLTLLPFVAASAPAPAAVPCVTGKVSCPSVFGMNHSGCW